MLTASLTLFVLSAVLPALIAAMPPSAVLGETRAQRLAYLPNLVFVLMLASFAVGIAHLLVQAANWSLGIVLFLAFEGAILVSTGILFGMKERHKEKLLRDAITAERERRAKGESAETRAGGSTSEPVASRERGGGCTPVILGDTGTADAEEGWTVSSLFSWHVYVYKLEVKFSVQPSQVEVTADAQTYDANWYELYLIGLGVAMPGGAILALIGAGSIAASHYHATQSAKGQVICLPAESGCVLIPNADPAMPADRHNEVTAAALVVANRLSSNIVQFQLTGIATMSGHVSVQSATLGGTLGGSIPVPAPISGPSGAPLPLTLTAGINVGVTLVPSPTAVRHLSRGRAVVIQCVAAEASGNAVAVPG